MQIRVMEEENPVLVEEFIVMAMSVRLLWAGDWSSRAVLLSPSCVLTWHNLEHGQMCSHELQVDIRTQSTGIAQSSGAIRSPPPLRSFRSVATMAASRWCISLFKVRPIAVTGAKYIRLASFSSRDQQNRLLHPPCPSSHFRPPQNRWELYWLRREYAAPPRRAVA